MNPKEHPDIVIVIFAGVVSLISILLYNILYYFISSLISLLVPVGISFLIYNLMYNKPDDKSLYKQFRKDIHKIVWIDKLNAISLVAKMMSKTVLVDIVFLKIATIKLPSRRNMVYIGIANRWYKL